MQAKQRWKPLSNLGIAAIALVLLISLCGLSQGYLVVNNTPRQADVIIVLGYPSDNNGSPSTIMQSRVEKGVELFKQGYAPIIIFSGGAARNEFVEANVMADYAISLGISESSVIQETDSRNTLENATKSLSIMGEHGWSTALVVTSRLHTRRVLLTFEHYGARVSVIAAEDPLGLKLYERMIQIVYEYFLLGWYKATGDI